MFSEIKLH